jgi:Kef-type K+ transport system membrane component KefB
MKKNLVFYFFMLIVLILPIALAVSSEGSRELSDPGNGIYQSDTSHESISILKHLSGKLLVEPGLLILQLIIIMAVARLSGFLFQRIGQPMVVGEIIAGIALGPSFLGAFAPGFFNSLFPPDSVNILQQLSQLGLIFFMFIIGMELDSRSFRKSASSAFLISVSSIVIPFVSGFILAFFLYPDFSTHHTRFISFASFLGATLSITAFPILARIVQERKYAGHPVGHLAISSAAIGDVIAWCMLAVVITIVKSSGIISSLLTIAFSVTYILLMIYVVKPFMVRLGKVYASREAMSKPIVALVFLLILLSTLFTDAIGINPLFGAFMAGVVMPENMSFKKLFTEKIEDVSLVILLPLFFVSTGLKTHIGLINSTHLILICFLIIMVASMSKVVGSLIASKYTGLAWKDSFVISVLMNSRGLMELIVLNIGYDLGILSPEIFAMLVIMALVTTLFTGPGLSLIESIFPEKTMQKVRQKTFRIMLSFANPKSGAVLLQLARNFAFRAAADTTFTALHISPRSDLSPENARVFEKESFSPIRKLAEQYKLDLNTVYRNTTEISSEIIENCETERPDFVLLGSARTIFSSDILGGVLKKVINETRCDVLIFNERNFSEIRSILLVYFGNGDDFLFEYAALLNHRSDRKFYSYHRGLEHRESGLAYLHSGLSVESVPGSVLEPKFLQSIDLVMVAESNWKALESKHNLPLELFPSLLIIHRGTGNNRLLQHGTAT